MHKSRSTAFAFSLLLALAAGHLSAAPTPGIDTSLLDRYIFVASRISNQITVIDARSDQVIERIDPGHRADKFLLSSSLGLLVASDPDRQRLSLYDLAAKRVAEVIEPGFRPELIQLNGDGDLLAAADPAQGRLLVTALDGRELRHEIADLPAPSDMVFDRSGERLLVASGSAPQIDIVSLAEGRVTEVIELGADLPGVVDLVRTPGGSTALALHGESGAVSVIDLKAGAQVKRLRLPGPALRGFPAGNSQFFLVPNDQDGSVSSISTWTHEETARVPAAPDVQGVNLGMFDTLGFAISRSDRKAVALNLQTGQREDTLELPGVPETSVSAEAGTKLYIALSSSDQVAVIDLVGRRLLRLIDGVGEEPWAVNRAGGLSYCH